jgi:D-alanyl-D-alanine carboxypeptidase (penicillin-binding protein 5/6)
VRPLGARRGGRWAPAAAVLALVLLFGGPAGPSAGSAGSDPSPARADPTPSPIPTALPTPRPSLQPPRISAAAAILVDLDTGQVLYRKRADRPRPVASLTKIMTALVVLEEGNLSDTVVVGRAAASVQPSELGLRAGQRIGVRDLLYGLLMQSANDAAIALAQHVAGSVRAFTARMNAEARALGLRHTRFRGPTGLDDRGYSTARDVATLARAAFARPLFARIVATRFHRIPWPSGRPRRIQNRDVLLWVYRGALGGKTGFTTPAGHCLMAAAERGGVRLLVVVLGAPGPGATRVFTEGATLLDYGFAAFRRVILVARGMDVGVVSVEGKAVPAVAGATLARLVRVDRLGAVGRRLVPDPALTLPVQAGQPVGRVVVTAGGRPVGVVPAVAASSIPGALPPPRARLDPALAGLLRVVAAFLRALAGGFL